MHLRFHENMEVLYINDTVPYTKKRIVGRYGIYDNEKTERSLIFLRWVATDLEFNRLLCYGVEDVHYKFQDGRYYVPGDAFKIEQNFCIPTSPLIHINDPVGHDEYLRLLETGERQIIPGVPNDRIFYSYLWMSFCKTDPICYITFLETESIAPYYRTTSTLMNTAKCFVRKKGINLSKNIRNGLTENRTI